MCIKCEGKQNISIYFFSPQEHPKKSVGPSSKTSVTNLANYSTMVFLKTATVFAFDLKRENNLNLLNFFHGTSHRSYISKN